MVNPDNLKPVPEWIMHIMAWMAGVAVIFILLSTMAWWPLFRILGD